MVGGMTGGLADACLRAIRGPGGTLPANRFKRSGGRSIGAVRVQYTYTMQPLSAACRCMMAPMFRLRISSLDLAVHVEVLDWASNIVLKVG